MHDIDSPKKPKAANAQTASNLSQSPFSTPVDNEPRLNPVYAALLSHYDVVGDPCRVRDPNRKGTVENAIQHTQGELKGRRFASIDDQNAHLQHWEARWASTRIHGRKKRQVMEMFLEEKPYLKPLPADAFRLFTQGWRTVDDAGLIQVEGAYYTALPANPHSRVMVRVFETDIEVLNLSGELLWRHAKAPRKGAFVMAASDRLFILAAHQLIGTLPKYCLQRRRVPNARIDEMVQAIIGNLRATRRHWLDTFPVAKANQARNVNRAHTRTGLIV